MTEDPSKTIQLAETSHQSPSVFTKFGEKETGPRG
jgi:hypothetical protein